MSGLCGAVPCPPDEAVPASYTNPWRRDTVDGCLWFAGMEAWTSYTPTLTNITLGDGTRAGAYIRLGRTIHFRATYVHGSTSSVTGSIAITVPVAAHADYVNGMPAARVGIHDSGVALYMGTIQWASASVINIMVEVASLAYVAATAANASTPMASWTTGDGFWVAGTYEAAS